MPVPNQVKVMCKSLISMRAFMHLEIGLPCRAGDAQDKEVLTMYWKYEVACKEANMSEEEIKGVRRAFNPDKMRLKREKERIADSEFVFISLDMEIEGFDEAYNLVDENCNVEEDAIWNVCLAQLKECLELIPSQEKEDVLALFDPTVSFVQYAEQRGIPKTTLLRKTEKVIRKLKTMMGVEEENS